MKKDVIIKKLKFYLKTEVEEGRMTVAIYNTLIELISELSDKEAQFQQPITDEMIEKIINDEPELPGIMPDEIWLAAQDKQSLSEVLRLTVRETKNGILNRYKSLSLKAQKTKAIGKRMEIRMRTNCDCMIASFAGLMGWSYDFAKTFFPERAITKTGYNWDCLIPYLRSNKIYLSWCPSKNEVNWSKPAMLDVPSLTASDKGEHIIFWDGTKIIDPSKKEIHYKEVPEEINCAYQISEHWPIPVFEESLSKPKAQKPSDDLEKNGYSFETGV